jgi:uncharacterized membrane protein YphA (DoxX/SURF4 family)
MCAGEVFGESFDAGYTFRMLSIFPELLFLSPLAALLIRVSVAIVFALSASRHIRNAPTRTRILGAIEAVVAILLFFGVYTQVAALVAIALIVAYFFMLERPFPKSTLVLLAVMSMSLVVTGAGPYAFDLPL